MERGRVQGYPGDGAPAGPHEPPCCAHLRRAVLARRVEEAAGGVEAHAAHGAAVGVVVLDQAVAPHIPQVDAAVLRCSRDAGAVGAEPSGADDAAGAARRGRDATPFPGPRRNALRVLVEGGQLRPLRCVPEADGLVVAPGHHESGVGRERRAAHPVAVPNQRPLEPARRQRPGRKRRVRRRARAAVHPRAPPHQSLTVLSSLQESKVLPSHAKSTDRTRAEWPLRHTWSPRLFKPAAARQRARPPARGAARVHIGLPKPHSLVLGGGGHKGARGAERHVGDSGLLARGP